jgi:hypothetical protein
MKLRYLLPLFLLTASYDLVTDYSFVDGKHPVHFDGEYRYVSKAKFRTHSVKGTHETYQDAHAFLYYSHFLNQENSLSWKVGYSFLDFDWKANPRFRQDKYNFVNANVGWVSNSIKEWRWILQAGVSVEAPTFNFGQTGVYYGMMWGRYAFAPNIGMHIGWCGYVGVENGYVLPILGIDWNSGKHWKFYGIFPINLSIHYLFNPHWSLVAEAATFGRPYRFPIRAHDGIGRYKNGIFEIYSKGIELDLRYKTHNAFWVSVGGGWNIGGWILIKDHANNHGKYYKYNGAPYVQGKLEFSF